MGNLSREPPSPKLQRTGNDIRALQGRTWESVHRDRPGMRFEPSGQFVHFFLDRRELIKIVVFPRNSLVGHWQIHAVSFVPLLGVESLHGLSAGAIELPRGRPRDHCPPAAPKAFRNVLRSRCADSGVTRLSAIDHDGCLWINDIYSGSEF